MKNSLLHLLIIFSFGLCLGCSAPKEANSTAVTGTPATVGDGTFEKPVILSASDLTRKFEENERAAVEKYNDKILAVSGRIVNIVETAQNVTVSLLGHHSMITVRCVFPATEKSDLANYQKLQGITLISKIDGMKMGSYVDLKGCKVQKR